MESEFKPAPVKDEINFDDFDKIDIRVGSIKRVEDVEGSRKLVKLLVDFGDHERCILAGIRQERENPEALAGVQALFVVNLPPRKMAGVISEGMLFDIGYSDNIDPSLAIPETVVPSGTRAG